MTHTAYMVVYLLDNEVKGDNIRATADNVGHDMREVGDCATRGR